MSEIEELARKLGFTEIRLVKLQAEYRRKHDSKGDEKLLAWLRTTFRENRDRLWLLSRRPSGAYTENPSEAVPLEPEAVDPAEIVNYRASRDARQNHQAEQLERVGALLGACQDIRSAVNELDPELKKRISRDLWKLKGQLDGLERKLRQGAA